MSSTRTLQQCKTFAAIAPSGAVPGNTNAQTSSVIDKQDYGYLQADIICSAMTASAHDNKPQALVLQESSQSANSAASFWSAFATASDFVIGDSQGTSPFHQDLHVDVRAAKRYLRFSITPGPTNTNGSDVAIVGKLAGGEAPTLSTGGANKRSIVG